MGCWYQPVLHPSQRMPCYRCIRIKMQWRRDIARAVLIMDRQIQYHGRLLTDNIFSNYLFFHEYCRSIRMTCNDDAYIMMVYTVSINFHVCNWLCSICDVSSFDCFIISSMCSRQRCTSQTTLSLVVDPSLWFPPCGIYIGFLFAAALAPCCEMSYS